MPVSFLSLVSMVHNSWPLSVLTHQTCTGTLMVNTSRQCRRHPAVKGTKEMCHKDVTPTRSLIGHSERV